MSATLLLMYHVCFPVSLFPQCIFPHISFSPMCAFSNVCIPSCMCFLLSVSIHVCFPYHVFPPSVCLIVSHTVFPPKSMFPNVCVPRSLCFSMPVFFQVYVYPYRSFDYTYFTVAHKCNWLFLAGIASSSCEPW